METELKPLEETTFELPEYKGKPFSLGLIGLNILYYYMNKR